MTDRIVEPPASGADHDQEPEPPASHVFIGFDLLKQRLPYGTRRLRDLVKKGIIPSIRLPGGRKRLFDWTTVRASLKRYERGGHLT